MSCANFPAARLVYPQEKTHRGRTEDAANESKKSSLRLCGELSLRNVLGRGLAALGLIVLAFPGGEDGSRPERKKFLGQIFYCPAYCIGNDILGLIAVGGKDKGERIKDEGRES